MAKQLVVVVHGVGVRDAGVSADLLASALDETPESTGAMSRRQMQAARLRPHSSDDFHLRELEIYNSGGKRQTFPARIRRYREYGTGNSKVLNERVIADFYWGDISSIGGGVQDLLLALLKTILGLSHIIRESAREVFPKKTGFDRWMRRTASFAALVMHGPIAAINIILVVGVLLAWLTGSKLGWGENWAIALTCLFAVIGGLWMIRRSRAFLLRHLGGWIFIFGLVMALVSWLAPIENPQGAGAVFSYFDTALKDKACDPIAGKFASEDLCKDVYSGIYLQGLRLAGIMGLCWVGVLGAALLVIGGDLLRSHQRKGNGLASLVLPSLSLMVLLWILLIGGVWAAMAGVGVIAEKLQLAPFLGALVIVVAGLMAIGTGALFSVVRTRLWAARTKPQTYMQSADENSRRHRLIIAPAILWAVWLFLAVLGISVLYQLAELARVSLPFKDIGTGLWLLQSDYFGTAMAIAAMAGSVLALLAQPIRLGLSIATDVITYLNDYSWNSVEAGAKNTSTFVERLPLLRRFLVPGEKAPGYWPRQRIKDRMRVMLAQVIRDEQPDELAVVSHSQGTVVAIDVLASDGQDWLKLLPQNAQLALVTMGSPYTHVHNHYFPSSFAALKSRKELAPVASKGVLSRWINIFRIDDFVGTHIDKQGKWPVEHPVAPNGHTYYWTDENVFPVLREFLDFRNTMAIAKGTAAASRKKPAAKKPRR